MLREGHCSRNCSSLGSLRGNRTVGLVVDQLDACCAVCKMKELQLRNSCFFWICISRGTAC